jgi:hypothetical protein
MGLCKKCKTPTFMKMNHYIMVIISESDEDDDVSLDNITKKTFKIVLEDFLTSYQFSIFMILIIATHHRRIIMWNNYVQTELKL